MLHISSIAEEAHGILDSVFKELSCTGLSFVIFLGPPCCMKHKTYRNIFCKNDLQHLHIVFSSKLTWISFTNCLSKVCSTTDEIPLHLCHNHSKKFCSV